MGIITFFNHTVSTGGCLTPVILHGTVALRGINHHTFLSGETLPYTCPPHMTMPMFDKICFSEFDDQFMNKN